MRDVITVAARDSTTTIGDDDDDDVVVDSHIALLKDSQSPHSLQNPPPLLPNKDDFFLNSSDLTPQEIANHLFRNSEILAPMVRASTTPLRTLAISHGASLVYTEELIDRSIASPTERYINEELGTIDYRIPKHTYSAKVQRRMENDVDNPDSAHGAVLLRIDPNIERHKLIYQMGTGEPNLALDAAHTVIQDVDGIDVNMGCPKKFSVSGGMGSALLSDTKRACDIISTLRRNIGCNKPISAKIRLLDEEKTQPTVDFVRALVQSGVNAIAIHGRIRGDESHIMARWGTLVNVVREIKMHSDMKDVPIIINGDLYTREDIREMKRRTGCDGIMLARPALYNVSLFHRGIEENEAGEAVGNNHDDQEKEIMPISQFQQTNHSGYYGYNSPLLHSRTSIVQEYIAHCVRYKAHSKNAKYVVCEMMNARRAPITRVPFLNMEYEGGQNIQSVCKCRSLNDLVKVWDCKWTIPMPSSSAAAAVRGVAYSSEVLPPTSAGCSGVEAQDQGDLHNYDDRYFLDHDKFLKERNDASLNDQLSLSKKKLLSESIDEEKKDDTDATPTSKRPKM